MRKRQVMSPWLLSIHEWVYEMKARVQACGAEMIMNGKEQSRVVSVFADDTFLLPESESKLQKAGDELRGCLVGKQLTENSLKTDKRVELLLTTS